jgi:hypothetical protein
VKQCIQCKETKENSEFRIRSDTGRLTGQCKECLALNQQAFYKKNKLTILAKNRNYYAHNSENIITQKKEYYAENKESIDQYNKEYRKENNNYISIRKRTYYSNNKEEILAKDKKYRAQPQIRERTKRYKKQYREDNREKITQSYNKWQREKKKNDPVYKIRVNISRMVNAALNKIGSSKNNYSFLDFVDWTPDSLAFHIESQWKDKNFWMTWENHGRYNAKTWDDNDSSTWTWQLDHIIPQSDLPYKNMKEENFKKCWALENLRPYSAKLNIIEGSNRTRHITRHITRQEKVNAKARFRWIRR